MTRRTLAIVALAAAAFAVLMYVASSDSVQVFHDPPPSKATDRPPSTRPSTGPVITAGSAGPIGEGPDSRFFAGVMTVLLIVLIIMLLHAVMTTWFRRLRIRVRARPPAPDHVVLLPDVEAPVVVLDVAAQLDALTQGTVRNAIVACWLQLEDDVASAGLPRHVAETSAEFTSRVLASSTLDASPVNELAALYREARFSQHEMDQHDRDRALTALQSIHAALGSRASDSVPAVRR